jgi:hypothetical protein
MGRERRLIEEGSADLESAIRRVVQVALTRTHAALPGVIDAYDAATQTATVTPQVKSQHRDEEGELVAEAMPAIQGAPVFFPRAGGFSITYPLTVGDPCLILFADRDISGYLETGNREAPPTGRTHAYQDAIILPGLAPSGDALDPAASTSGIEIRNDDGTTVLRVGSAGIEVESAAAFSVDSIGPITLTRGANELLAILVTVLTTLSTDTAGAVPLSGQSVYAAELAKVTAMRT